MNVPNPIDPSNQAWQAKDIIGEIGMLAFVLFLISTYLLIVEKSTFFAGINQPLPRNIGLRGKGLSLSITAAILFPFIVLWTAAFGLWDLVGLNNMKLFPLQQCNRAFVLIIGINLLGLIMLAVFLLTDGKKQKATLRDLGLTSEGSSKLDWKLIA